jgi:O-antigen ligase
MLGRQWGRRAWAVAVSGLVLLVVAAQAPWTQSAAMLPRRLALHTVAVVCLLQAARRLRLGLASALALAWVVWQALAWTTSEVRWLGLPRLMDGVAALALLVAVAGGRLPRRVLLWPHIAAGSLGALLGLLEQWVEVPGLAQATRPSGFFVSRAVAGEYVAASLLLTVGFLVGRRRPAALLLVALQVGFLVSTRSRTGWAVAGLGLLWVGSRLAVREQRAVGATVALAVILAVLLTPGPRLSWQAPRPYAESLGSLARLELGGRLDTWRNTWAMVGAHPWLGVGPGGFAATYPRYHRAVVRDRAFSAGQQIEEPHNEWLRGAVEWGLPGLTLGGLLLGTLLLGVPRRPARRTVALVGALAALGISSLVSLTFVAPPTLLLATCVAGWVGRGTRARQVRVQPVVARAAGAALAGLLAWVDVPHGKASWAWRQAEVAATRGHLRSAYEGLRAAAPSTHEARAYMRLAEMALQAQAAPRCAEAAREGLQRVPASTRLLTLLGECEALQGNTSAAREAFDRGLELFPEDPYALWGLAQLSTPAMRATLMKQAAEAARLEWALLPPQLASRERERLRLLAQQLEEALRATEP